MRKKPGGFLAARERAWKKSTRCQRINSCMIARPDPDCSPTPHLGPPIPLDQLADDGLQRDAVQWVAGMGDGRWLVHAVSAS